jgi:hypothetical protein
VVEAGFSISFKEKVGKTDAERSSDLLKTCVNVTVQRGKVTITTGERLYQEV